MYESENIFDEFNTEMSNFENEQYEDEQYHNACVKIKFNFRKA